MTFVCFVIARRCLSDRTINGAVECLRWDLLFLICVLASPFQIELDEWAQNTHIYIYLVLLKLKHNVNLDIYGHLKLHLVEAFWMANKNVSANRNV